MTFPAREWARLPASDVGLKADRIDELGRRVAAAAGGASFRWVVTRYGYLVAEWGHGIPAGKPINQSSSGKSYYSTVLGIAVEEGVIAGLDAHVRDYYPQFMDIGEDEGPKPGRYAFPENRDITFRQLIGNTSGYMKPGESPGQAFHYQTFGMNILTNAIATAYGLYDSDEPARLPGFAKLIEDRMRDRIDGTWQHFYTDFDHPPRAKKHIFGHSLRVSSTALDTARAGHLWLNGGAWAGKQIVPADYMRTATATNGDIMANAPESDRKYGLGFWVNDHGKQWPDLPRDSFAALGAGAKMTWVCPSLGLVATGNPGVWTHLNDEDERTALQNELLVILCDAVS
jgi:CubicO group peptidase (beta-lactamase class C family)